MDKINWSTREEWATYGPEIEGFARYVEVAARAGCTSLVGPLGSKLGYMDMDRDQGVKDIHSVPC